MMNTSLLIASTLGLALAACGDNVRVTRPAGPPRAVVVAGDFTPGHPGLLTTLDPATGIVAMNAGPAKAVGADPVLRHAGSELLIVNRGENNITILDDQTLAFKEQLGTGDNSNPQDVAALGNKLYVATFGGKGLTVLTRGSTATRDIDLPADDPDGEPNCNSVYLVDTSLYVSCELLDSGFEAQGPGKVYIVDTAKDTVKTAATVTLTRENPFGLFEQIPADAPHGGDLLIASVGDFTPAAGCIERVATGPAPTAAGCVLENTVLGGYSSRIAFEVDAGIAMIWTAVSVSFSVANLRGYDLKLDTLWDAPINPSTEVVADVAHCPSGEVVIVDATKNANGLRVYQSAVEQTTAAMPIGLGFFSSHGLVCY